MLSNYIKRGARNSFFYARSAAVVRVPNFVFLLIKFDAEHFAATACKVRNLDRISREALGNSARRKAVTTYTWAMHTQHIINLRDGDGW